MFKICQTVGVKLISRFFWMSFLAFFWRLAQLRAVHTIPAALPSVVRCPTSMWRARVRNCRRQSVHFRQGCWPGVCFSNPSKCTSWYMYQHIHTHTNIRKPFLFSSSLTASNFTQSDLNWFNYSEATKTSTSKCFCTVCQLSSLLPPTAEV